MRIKKIWIVSCMFNNAIISVWDSEEKAKKAIVNWDSIITSYEVN